MTLSSPTSHACNASLIWEWKRETTAWRQRSQPTNQVLSSSQVEEVLRFKGSDVLIILAKADGIRECSSCRSAFTSSFQIPNLWWKHYCKNSNGYFGSRTTTDKQGQKNHISKATYRMRFHVADIHRGTWLRFLTKEVKNERQYHWTKLNVYTHWLASTGQTAIIIFDARFEIEKKFPLPTLEGLTATELADAFWCHPYLVEELVQLQDTAVWGARTQIRNRERQRIPLTQPKPDYVTLHELARHVIHISETLDLAINATGEMLHQHKDLTVSQDSAVYQDVHERLEFFRHMLKSLLLRSHANTERLKNEIQLAFNTVAQYDAGLSLKLNQSTKADSAAMRTVAFISAAFLPATFISAVFSMSFFNYNPDVGWKVSDKLWVYWVFAAPATLVTVWLWHRWQRTEASHTVV